MSSSDQIIHKAEELFLSFGFKSVSMDDLCDQLGISKKTLYKHVANKEELVSRVILSTMARQENHISDLIAQNKDPIEELLFFAQIATKMLIKVSPTALYDLRKYYRSLWEKMDKKRASLIYNCIFNNLDQGKSLGLYRLDVDSDLIASLYVRMSTFMIDQKAIDAPRERKVKLYFEFVKYHIRGIATDKGNKLLNKYQYFWND